MNHTQPFLRRHRGLTIFFGLTALALISALPGTSTQLGAGSALPNHKGGVHGTVYVAGPAATGSTLASRIPVPDHTMRLLDSTTGALVAEATTDVFGRYYFPPQELGVYSLTWQLQSGWRGGAYADPLVIEKGTVTPDQVRLRPVPGNVVVVGTVTLRDGSTAGIIDEYFGLEVTPEVSLSGLTGAPIAGPVRANAGGGYALSGRAQQAAVRLEARVEAASSSRSIPFRKGPPQVQDVALPNTAPRINELYLADTSGKGVRGAMAGDTLTSVDDIFDGDSDPVSINWRPEFTTAAGALTQAGNQVDWTLPNIAGGYSLYAMVSDGRGGYAKGSVRATIGKTQEVFSGRATDRSTGDPIAGAEVEVNQQRTVTDATGNYELRVPIAERYVLNVRSANYALAGRGFDDGDRGRTWRMVRRERTVFDPTRPVRLVDKRRELGDRRPATLRIPPNTLVDPSGNLPTGNLTASFATIDVTDGESASDYTATLNGRDTGLMSYGVLSVEITDAAGQEYQIRSGGRARLIMPIAGTREGQVPAGAPDLVPVWSYDESGGRWMKTGEAQLDRASASYVGTVNHFSEINVDAPGADSCIRVLVDPSLIGKTLRVSDVAGDGIDYTEVEEDELDQPLNVIYTIPPSQLVRLEVLDSPGGSPIPGVVIERFDAGNPSAGWERLEDGAGDPLDEVMAGGISTPVFPEYPYSQSPITVYLKQEASSSGPFLVYKGAGSQTAALQYYDQVNPQIAGDGNRDTLQEWWAHNGFQPDGSVITVGNETYARTSYLNNNDLGSGRDMHLYGREDGTSAAWVSNYGQFNQDQGNADLALSQDNDGDLVATVCMEFSPMEDAAGQFLDLNDSVFTPANFASLTDYLEAVKANSVVKFFVYADADGAPEDELQIAADLDGYGPKFIPNLCLNCHGGSAQQEYLSPSSCSINAYFRELDYHTYRFPGGALTPTAVEQEAFKVQNEIVLGSADSLISSDAIKELIDIWYRSGPNDIEQDDSIFNNGAPVADSFPPAWNTALDSQALYAHVVGRSCRTCHIAFGEQDGSPSNLSFNSASSFEVGGNARFLLEGLASDPPQLFSPMPHAAVTYRNFWTSYAPSQPQEVIDFID